MYRLIIFDVDGTLIDSKVNCLTALHNILLRETKISHTLEELDYAFGYNGKHVLDDFHLPHTLIDDWVAEEIRLARLASPYPGIHSLLKNLRYRHYTLGIATSKYREELEPFLGTHRLLNYFDFTACFDDVNQLKPDPEILDKLSGKSGVPKKNILFIGDSLSDMRCAENAGVDFALAGWGASEKIRALCENVLHSPEELLRIL